MEDLSISKIMYAAIAELEKAFGGTDIKLVSEKMYRKPPTEFAKAGMLGVDVLVEGIPVFLPHESVAEEILWNIGRINLAEEWIWQIIKDDLRFKIQ